MALYSIGLLLAMSSVSILLPSESTWISVAVRAGGVTCIVLASHLARPFSKFTLENEKAVLSSAWIRAFAVPAFLYILVATLPHGMWFSFLSYSIGSIMLMILVRATSRNLRPIDLLRSLTWSLTIIVGGSLVAGRVVPAMAIEGERLRGLAENANGLGFFAFLLGAVAILLVRRVPLKIFFITIALIALLWSSSRTSAGALGILAVLYFLRRWPVWAALSASIFILAGDTIASWMESFAPFEGLLRTNNSRQDSFDAALLVLADNPIFGVGMGQESTIIASSPLRALSNAGLVGLVVVILFWVSILLISFRQGSRTTIFAISCIVHSCFESWLLSPTSPLIMLFGICWWAVAIHDGLDRRRRLSSSLPVAQRVQDPAVPNIPR